MSKVESLKRTVKAWELYDFAVTFNTDPRDLVEPLVSGRRPAK
jgi:hypothetical protein